MSFTELDLIDKIAAIIAAETDFASRLMTYDINYSGTSQAVITLNADMIAANQFDFIFSTTENIEGGATSAETEVSEIFDTSQSITADNIRTAILLNTGIASVTFDSTKRVFTINAVSGYLINIISAPAITLGISQSGILFKVKRNTSILPHFDLVQNKEFNGDKHFPIEPTFVIYMPKTSDKPDGSPYRWIDTPDIYIDFCTLNKIRLTSYKECFQGAKELQKFLNRGNNMTLDHSVRINHAGSVELIGNRRFSEIGFHTVCRIPLSIEFRSQL